MLYIGLNCSHQMCEKESLDVSRVIPNLTLDLIALLGRIGCNK